MSEQVTEVEDEQGDRDTTVLVARPDRVVQGTIEQADAAQLTIFQDAAIQTEKRSFILFDEALPDGKPANRWHIGVEPSGVLNVAAWLDAQDRDEDRPQTVLLLAPHVWRAVSGPTKDFGED